MKVIDNIEELKGKTINDAKIVDCDEQLAIIFDDDTSVFIKAEPHFECAEIAINDSPTDYTKRDAGVITEDELNLIQRQIEEENKRRGEALMAGKRQRDLGLLVDLKPTMRELVDAGVICEFEVIK